MRYEWDPGKAKGNWAKHGISFTAAARALVDPCRVESIDERFAYGEERLQAICQLNGDVLFVVYTLRGDLCRIISARRATKHEQRKYVEGQNLHA